MARPTIMTPETIQELEKAFIMGCSDIEACLLAKISKTTLYNYQEVNPEFVDRKEALKNHPTLQARKSVYDKLEEGDVNTAKWYLERKKKDEFSTSTDLNLGGQNGANPIVHEVRRTIVDPQAE